jgi:hypothetical protein
MTRHRSASARARAKPDNAKVALQPIITFTGNRRNDHYEVLVHGQVVESRLACLKALIALVLAHAGSGRGFVRLNPVTVCRLRRAIDDVIGAGAGMILIETGISDEYRLMLPNKGLNGHVALAPCFFELVQLKIVSRDCATKLKRRCQRKSSGNRQEMKKKSIGR